MRNRERGCSVYVTPARPTCRARAGEFLRPLKLFMQVCR